MSIVPAEEHEAMRDVCMAAEKLSAAMVEAECRGTNFDEQVDAEWMTLTKAIAHWRQELARALGLTPS